MTLTEIGVHYSQGYGIAKPCPICDLTLNTKDRFVSKVSRETFLLD